MITFSSTFILINFIIMVSGTNFEDCEYKQWFWKTEVINAANYDWRASSSEIWWTNTGSDDQQRQWKKSKETVSDNLKWDYVHSPPKVPCGYHLQQLCRPAGPLLWLGSCVFQMCFSVKIQLQLCFRVSAKYICRQTQTVWRQWILSTHRRI